MSELSEMLPSFAMTVFVVTPCKTQFSMSEIEMFVTLQSSVLERCFMAQIKENQKYINMQS